MNTADLLKQQRRLERRISNTTFTELHRECMRKAHTGTDTVKMHEFRGGRTVSIQKRFGEYRIDVYDGADFSFIENRFCTEQEAVKFATVLWGNIGWNIL